MPTCLVCGKDLVKRDHESSARFNKKKFCSLVCTRAYMKEHECGWWNRHHKPYMDYLSDRNTYYEEEYVEECLSVEDIIYE